MRKGAGLFVTTCSASVSRQNYMSVVLRSKMEQRFMEFYQIKYFLAVAKLHNFTQAAEACNVSQPALTRAIQRLEHHMGGALLQRDPRHASLTQLGKAVHPFLQSMVEFADSATREAKKQTTARKVSLSFGLTSTIASPYLANLLMRFNALSPKFEMKVLYGTSQQVQTMLISGDIEIGIAALPSYVERIKEYVLFDDPFHVAFSPEHRFKNFETVSIAEIAGEQFLERLNCEYLDVFRKELLSFKPDSNVICRSQDEGLIQEMVAEGTGCSILPKSLLAHQKIMSRPLSDLSFARAVSAITLRGVQHTEIQRKFLNLCTTKALLDYREDLPLLAAEVV